MTSLPTKLGALILFATAGALTVSCGPSTQDGEPNGDHSGAARAIETPSEARPEPPELGLPIQRYLMTPKEEETILLARNRLTEKCMKNSGFTNFKMPSPALNPVDIISRRYGLADFIDARANGYEVAKPKESNDLAKFYEGLSSNERFKLLGESGQPVDAGTVPKDYGCMGAALETINGTKPPFERAEAAAMKVQIESWRLSFRDPRTVSQSKKWSSCMKAHGYSFATPMDAPGDPSMGKAQQIPIAISEVECNLSAGLLKLWNSVEIGYQNNLITKDLAALKEGRHLMDSRLAVARRALVGEQ